jgi:hypothetical protein
VCSLADPIRWDLLQDRHADPLDEGDEAVAELCWKVGAAVWMGYGLRQSSTSVGHAARAFAANYFYDPAVVNVPPANKDIVEMSEEITWLRPIQMDGWNTSRGGHNWVAAGYNKGTDPDRQFWINLGWGGSSDGWYSCDAMQFPVSQNYIKNIAPLNVVKFVGSTTSGTGAPNAPYRNLTEAVVSAPNNATLIFKAGSVHTVSSSGMTINRPLQLKGWNVNIRR